MSTNSILYRNHVYLPKKHVFLPIDPYIGTLVPEKINFGINTSLVIIISYDSKINIIINKICTKSYVSKENLNDKSTTLYVFGMVFKVNHT